LSSWVVRVSGSTSLLRVEAFGFDLEETVLFGWRLRPAETAECYQHWKSAHQKLSTRCQM
jgi:hypothetical protein